MKFTSRPYHYFISGLPDLRRFMRELPFDQKVFFNMLELHIDTLDLQHLKLLLAPVDHHNLLHVMLSRPTYYINAGNFTQEQLTYALEHPEHFPTHIQQFIHEYHHTESIYETPKSWENRLTEIYIEYMQVKAHPLLQKWFQFEQNYRNIVMAINCHKYGTQYQNFLIGNNQVSRQLNLEASPLLDGLRGEISYISALTGLFRIQDLVEREKTLIEIKWKHLDEIAFFEAFGLGYLIAYTLKLLMIERWNQLEAEEGEKSLRKILHNFYEAALNS